MVASRWPDTLTRPDPADLQRLLTDFWHELAGLPDLVLRGEHLLAERCTSRLRATVLDMMLGLNGLAYPQGTHHLNTYLSARQRAAIEKTLIAPDPDADAWIAQAVALVVIYRWYAPQLVDAHDLTYPAEAEATTWRLLSTRLPTWPATVTSS
jgi:hypothetical protein